MSANSSHADRSKTVAYASDTTAAAQIYEENRKSFLLLAETIVGCPSLAEDIVNESFILFAKRLEQKDAHLTAGYAVQIVRNLALQMKRKESREKAIFAPLTDSRVVDQVEAQQVNPELTALWRDETRVFLEAFDELPVLTRRAMRLLFEEQLKIREIADRLGVSIGRAHGLVREGISHCESKLRIRDGSWEI